MVDLNFRTRLSEVKCVPWEPARQAALSDAAPIVSVRKYELEATQRLLGDTITINEQAWQEPVRLPGWTRAHVATHIARNADALVRSIDSLLTGRSGLMYDSDEDRDLAIERGSERSGLELQIDLDTSAGHLHRRLNALESVPGELMVELLPGQLLRSDLMPLIRLNEVVLHHVDLECGFEMTHVEPVIARWLLEWHAMDAQLPDGVGIRLSSDSGFALALGSTRSATVLSGPDAVLLGWLTGRLSTQQAIELPASPNLR